MKVYKFYWNFDDEIPSFEFKITKDVNYFFDKKEIENLIRKIERDEKIANKYFSKLFNKKRNEVKVPEGFELIEKGEIPENLRKQGYRHDGDPIGQKNGVGVPTKTDKIIRIRKIKNKGAIL